MRFVTTVLLSSMLFVLGLGTAVLAETVETGEETNVTPVQEQMMTEFYMQVGDYYEVSYGEVANVLETGISDDELAVAFFVAAKGEASATEIASRRVAGEAWYKLYQSQGLYSNDFWIPLKGKADQRTFGRLVSLLKGKWDARLILKDFEVVNLVNISLMRSIYPKNAPELSSLRADGLQFAYILHRSIRNAAFEHKLELAQEEQ